MSPKVAVTSMSVQTLIIYLVTDAELSHRVQQESSRPNLNYTKMFEVDDISSDKQHRGATQSETCENHMYV